MEKFNLGIPYFDQALNSLETRTLYGVHSNNAKLAQLFVAPIITNLLEHKKSVLILCDTTANILVDTYKIFNFDTQPYIESQQLVILEQPPELSSILSNLNNLEIVFDDLLVHTNCFTPDFIFIESLMSFLPKNNSSVSRIIINKLINFLQSLPTTCIIDFSDIEYDLVLFFEKQMNSIFSLKYSDKHRIHQLTYKQIKSDISKEFAFSLESNRFIDKPNFYTGANISVNDIETVYIYKEYKALENILIKVLTTQIKFVLFDRLESILDNLKDKNMLVFLPGLLKNENGVKIGYELKCKYNSIKLILLVDNLISVQQKIRFLRMGIDGFLEIPFSIDKISELLAKLYPIVTHSSSKRQISLLYTKDIKFNVDNQGIVYFDNIYRELKNYLYKTFSNASSIQFIKIKMHNMNINSVAPILKKHDELLCLFVDNVLEKEVYLIAAFENISQKAKQEIYAQLKIAIVNSTHLIQRDSENVLKKMFIPEQQSTSVYSNISEGISHVDFISYPFDEVNYDQLIKRLFEHD